MFGTKVHRAIAGAGIALMMAVGAGACSGGGDSVDKDALLKKVKSDSDLKSNFDGAKDKDKAAKCVVDAAEKYGDSGKLKDYLKGKGNFVDVVSKDNQDKANKSVVNCMK